MGFDKHIPIPKVQHPQFRDMDIGDSVFVPHEGSILTSAAYTYAKTIQKRDKSYRFTGKSVTEGNTRGIRIWRTA
jgi:hypothetical protein